MDPIQGEARQAIDIPMNSRLDVVTSTKQCSVEGSGTDFRVPSGMLEQLDGPTSEKDKLHSMGKNRSDSTSNHPGNQSIGPSEQIYRWPCWDAMR